MSDDQWRVDLDGHLTALSDAVTQVFRNWIDAPADQPETLMQAARSITSSATTSACQASLAAIESWLCEQHNGLVGSVAEGNGVRVRSAWRMHPDGWLVGQVQSDLRNVAQATGRAREACVALAEFVASNSGVLGFAKNMLIGAINPGEGLAALFGESSMDEEGRRLNAAIESAFDEVDNLSTALVHAVDTAVVTRWNTKTIVVLDAIEEEVQLRSAPRQAAGAAEPSEITGQRNWSGARWIGGLALMLVLASGAWFAYPFVAAPATGSVNPAETSAGARPTPMGILDPGELRSGPGQSFEVIGVTEKPTATQILDDSVPGWLKVRTADGRDGWVARNRLAD